MKMVECYECLKYTICKQKEIVYCSKLYEHITETGKFPEDFIVSMWFCRDDTDMLQYLDGMERIFRKYMPKHNVKLQELEKKYKERGLLDDKSMQRVHRPSSVQT